jgi:hypothetical protein
VRRARLALCLAAAAALAGCGEGPLAGELSVRLSTPRSTDRAILFVVVGPVRGVGPAAGSRYRVFAAPSPGGDSTRVTVVAPPGSGVAPGEIARIGVDDVRRAASYVVAVRDAASATFAVGDTAGLTLMVARP